MFIPRNLIQSSTPKAMTDVVKKFCRGIAPHPPVFVPVRPDADAIVAECFQNVAARVRAAGGEIVYGWSIWEWPDAFIEAEHHGVWKSPTGELIDVTPKPEREKTILFLPDPETTYDWEAHRRLDNRRLALVDDPYLHEYLAIAANLSSFIEKKSAGRMVTFNPNDIRPLLLRQRDLLGYLVSQYGRERSRSPGKIGRNDPCPCGSGKKYKKCHGESP